MQVSDCAKKMSTELGFEVTEARIRRYSNIITVDRKENEYRDIDDANYMTLMTMAVLFEMGISQDDVVSFIKGKLTPMKFMLMVEKVHSFKSNLVPIAESVLSQYSFDRI